MKKKLKGLLTCFKATLINRVAWPIYDDTLKCFLQSNIMFLLIILSVVYLYKSVIRISCFRNNGDKTLFKLFHIIDQLKFSIMSSVVDF